LERARQAIALAQGGRQVALVSSGDIGIYAMASPVFDLLAEAGWPGHSPEVVVYPGISAIQAVAARLGAPLGHDFCTISLSDLLTPWPVIERRLQAAAWGDFVIAFYNPRSHKRDWQLPAARDILLAYRPLTTPVALIRNVTRPDEQVTLTTLSAFDPAQVDMFSLVLVGNSQSYILGERLVTPRGYSQGAGEQGSKGAGAQGRKGARDTLDQAYLVPTAPAAGQDSYPLTLTHMATRQAVVVGGGPVGQRKVTGLLAAGARVRLISPEATGPLRAWAEAGLIEWLRRPYQPGDVAGAQLVYAATNQRAVNRRIAAEAKAEGHLCNVADRPDEGDFHLPAVHRRPGLVVAVSSGGASPGRARRMRDTIATWLDNQDREEQA
jgi:cobalt-precorrin 5A hydrolase/precorrin-3B C17-methyltransferase